MDNSGAVLPGVKVTITNVQTGISTAITTNSAGIYDVPSLPTGAYTLTFAKEGFKQYTREGVTLQLQTIGIDEGGWNPGHLNLHLLDSSRGGRRAI